MREKQKNSKKKKCLQKCFHSSKYVRNHVDVRFFLLISIYSQSLNDVNICTALCDSFCTTCCIFSAQIALQLSQVLAIHFFEYMNF